MCVHGKGAAAGAGACGRLCAPAAVAQGTHQLRLHNVLQLLGLCSSLLCRADVQAGGEDALQGDILWVLKPARRGSGQHAGWSGAGRGCLGALKCVPCVTNACMLALILVCLSCSITITRRQAHMSPAAACFHTPCSEGHKPLWAPACAACRPHASPAAALACANS